MDESFRLVSRTHYNPIFFLAFSPPKPLSRFPERPTHIFLQAGIGSMAAILTDSAPVHMKEALELEEASRVLFFSTEGDTDRKNYAPLSVTEHTPLANKQIYKKKGLSQNRIFEKSHM